MSLCPRVVIPSAIEAVITKYDPRFCRSQLVVDFVDRLR
ncbi:hypothetical protein MGWOODY_XGa2213 [hydrothermal vent metagenome]|uniref:Uncharacterized protein n=1 Tax=hydrothermal vent metagenome TaxID=652676 RepID=A0A160TV11_9ZZZZ